MDGHAVSGDEWDDSAESFVRPYAVTMGRTTPRQPLELLALVRTTESGRNALRRREIHSPEAIEIVRLCVEIHSVAEIGARLHLPLVVVQVLVDDLHRAGVVTVDRPQDTERPSIDIIERVLNGLARL